MQLISIGNEDTVGKDIGNAFQALKIDGDNTTVTLTEDSRVSISVQLGVPTKLLQGGEVIAIYAKHTTSIGDSPPLPQKMVSVPSGQFDLYVTLDEFDALDGDTIAVYAKSSDSNDSVIGSKVWAYNHVPVGGGGASTTNIDFINQSIVYPPGPTDTATTTIKIDSEASTTQSETNMESEATIGIALPTEGEKTVVPRIKLTSEESIGA